jgi:hypothetical protein
MPAQSQQQQKLFGLALAVKRGEVPASEVSDEVKAIVDRMSEKDIEDFAGTSHKGLPKKVEQQMREMVREIMRERVIAELTQSVTEDGKMQDGEDDPCWKGYEMVGMKMKDGKEVPNCVPKNESVDEALSVDPRIVESADSVNEEKYTVIDPKGNQKGVGLKMQAAAMAKKMGGEKAGYFVVPNKNALKARRALEKFKGDFKNPKLKDMMADLFYESVNEAASRTAMEIGGLTGMNKDAIQKFVDTNELDIEKVFQFVKKGKLSDRMEMVSAIAGKPGNPIQKKMIKMFSESINEGASTEEKKIVMMAIKKIAKYRNVSLDYAVGDVIRAAEELERDIQKGKVK